MTAQITNPALSGDRLREFAATVEQGSVSAAARVLDLPRSTLSRRLGELEAALGVRLLHRETRRLVLTPAGRELYARARRVVADTDAAFASVRRLDDVPRGPLRVSVPDSRMAAADLFVAFAQEFPEVRLEVSTTPEHVDLVASGIDVAIRFGEVSSASLTVRRLWTARFIAAASPGYLEARGLPRSPDELLDHDCIVGFGGGATPDHSWPLLAGGFVSVNVRFASSDLELRRTAAAKGLGIALLPHGPIQQSLHDGSLRPVLEEQVGRESPCSLVFVDREFMPAQLRVFIDRAVAHLQALGAGLTTELHAAGFGRGR